MDNNSYLNNIDLQQIEELYNTYLANPESVDYGWQKFFEGFDFSNSNFKGKKKSNLNFEDEFKVINLINAYRERGHYFTKTNPVRTRRQYSPTLDIENFDLTKSDLEKEFQAGSEIGIGKAKLKDIIAHLQTTYCRSMGVEFHYIRHKEIYEWLLERMETTKNLPNYTVRDKKQTLQKLTEAVLFEKFIHKKFPGQKRFSLEGAESLIPAMAALIYKGSTMGVEEFVIGMPHRGRLNVLANILHKSYTEIFSEFEGKEYEDEALLGDVKYHLGYTSKFKTQKGKKVKLTLTPNPSHLEAVNPVVEGIVRARLNHDYNGDASKIAPILIHGDASVAGQGIVYEVLQMSELKGYKTGGTIHLVVNNQIGFTTNYVDARSSTYCTDIAKIVQSPIFHVNGDDVEEVIYAVQFAMEFRQKFNKDVFIDLLCYRKYGHNEGDEPRFTQPLLYKAIEKHQNPRDIYAEKLASQGVMTLDETSKLNQEFEQHLEVKYKESEKIDKVKVRQFLNSEYRAFDHPAKNDLLKSVKTGVVKSELIRIAERINTLPTDKKFFKKIDRIVEDRRMMMLDNRMDWAMAELLAYGTLLEEGFPVRLSGQDSERGTFAHRHASFVVEETDEKYFPLKNISKKQANFHVFNSLLSEYGVLGFEYGYSLANPKGLTIWEAQFGDFANVAQVIFDQYISSAFEKWGMMNSLVLYLPHGYEGQGPEHSSGRIERFLNLTADNNMQVVVPTTPANMFHLLRRQMHWNVRIPLVIFTPKSLLRHPMVTSSVDELAEGYFHELIEDTVHHREKIQKLVFTYGKLYYDLHKRQAEEGVTNMAIVRVEQLFPLPIDQIKSIIAKYPKLENIYWVQDEPSNMGAWSHIQRFLPEVPFTLISRAASASPAGGLMFQHNTRLKKILDNVFEEKVLA